MVVLVLVALWAVVLTPRAIRHLREHRSQSSIESFHEQLHLLERTGPKLVAPAYRLHTAYASNASAPPEHSVTELPTRRPSLVLLDPVAPAVAEIARAATDARESAGAPVPAPAASVPRARAEVRRRGRKRRRDVLLGLVATVVVTAVLGAMHGLHLLWAVTGLSALAVGGYVALAYYAQILDADRQASRPVSIPSDWGAPWAERPPRHAVAEDHDAPGVAILDSRRVSMAGAGFGGGVAVRVPRHAATGG